MRIRRPYLCAGTALLVAWCLYWLFGGWGAKVLASRWGDLLLRVAKGKFQDPTQFVHNRLQELLWLVTLLMVWIAVHRFIKALLQRHKIDSTHTQKRWIFHGLAGFVMLNVLVGLASHTALYWGVMGAGCGVENYMQFNFKRILLEENQAPRKAVLVGSSQTRSEIDENLLNDRLGTNLWTTELHFPGSKAYDVLLIEPQLRRADPSIVICYFSENYLYLGSRGEVVPNFMTFAELSDAWRRAALGYVGAQSIGYGLLGDALPLFRCRDVLSRRLLGPEVMNLKQAGYDASLNEDLSARARQVAEGYRINAESEFQKRAIFDFVGRCKAAGRTVVLIDGGCNPILMRALDPAVRQDMVAFLHHLETSFSNVVVVRPGELAKQTEADFEDLSHVTPEMQRRFTESLAVWLETHLAEHRP